MTTTNEPHATETNWFETLGRVSFLEPRARSIAGKLLITILISVISGVVAVGLDNILHVHSPSMTFLCGVILCALWFGQRIGLAAALSSFFVYQLYLVEPRGSFTFFPEQNDWLTLVVFVFAAVLVGGLAGRLHDERERARDQARIFAGLFGISRTMSGRDLNDAIVHMANGVREIAAREAVVFTPIDRGVVVSARSPPDAEAPAALRQAALSMMLFENRIARSVATECDDWIMHPLEGPERPIAVLAWKPRPRALEDGRALAVRLLVELAQIAIERSVSNEQRIKFDALAETERLRSALMASMSHDFRTPLSTILASASSLLAFGDRFSPATSSDLLIGIQEEAERLNRFVGNILDMTRLEADVLKVRRELTDPLEVLDSLAARYEKRLGRRRLELSAPAAAPSINVDPILLEQAMANVIENALVYTQSDALIRIGASYTDDRVAVWVEDDGPGVPAAELPRIFDKFHRLDSSTNSTHSVGLGLAITKGFVEAMEGAVSAAPAQGAPSGLRVEFSFPREADKAPA